ncbi:MAG: hypothetical protein R3E79_29590 [Caldilineaceae bacterium]
MPNVLTTASPVVCGHGGPVTVSSSAKLTVKQNPVLLKSSIASKAVSGCTTVPDPNTSTKACTTVASVTAGEATKLTVRGNPVMLDTLAGSTDGTIGGTLQTLLSATAGQSQLVTK